MILPIVAFGHPVLRKVCEPITTKTETLTQLIADMWQTMYHTNGVGLAAPQVNQAIRMFMVDSQQIIDGLEPDEVADYVNEKPIKQLFINPKIVATGGTEWSYNEGCLSIPKVRENVMRPEWLELEYLNENMELITQKFDGVTARIIFHEYDHIEGKLFIDYLKPLKKRLIKKKLDDISKGRMSVDYRMLLPKL